MLHLRIHMQNKHISMRIIWLVSFVCIVAGSYGLNNGGVAAKVTKVIDGNTVEIVTKRTKGDKIKQTHTIMSAPDFRAGSLFTEYIQR